MGGCIPPPLFWVGGWPVQTSPHFLKIRFDIYCKETDLLNCKTIKNSKIARSLRSLAHKCTSETRYFAVLPVHVFFSWHHLCKERCRIKQTLCKIMARKSIAGLPILQVKGTRRSQGGIILGSLKNHQWLKSEIPHWNIVHCIVSFALSHLCISNNTSEIWYIKCTLY